MGWLKDLFRKDTQVSPPKFPEQDAMEAAIVHLITHPEYGPECTFKGSLKDVVKNVIDTSKSLNGEKFVPGDITWTTPSYPTVVQWVLFKVFMDFDNSGPTMIITHYVSVCKLSEVLYGLKKWKAEKLD